MDPFQPWHELVDLFVYHWAGLSPTSPWGQALDFFLFDTVKILILLVLVIFAVSLVRTFFPPEKIRDTLAKLPRPLAHLAASALGIITPFCSCSAVPLFLGFVEAGVPLGVTFSFLVASPMVNEVALVMLLGLFGWQIALLYLISGVGIAMISGALISRIQTETLLEETVLILRHRKNHPGIKTPTGAERLSFARDTTAELFLKVWPWVLVGIGVGAFLHGFIPVDLLTTMAGKNSWYAVPLAVLAGIPLYSNAAGVLPLVAVLTEKGMAMGTALAFMMSVTALSLPEFIILRKVMKLRLILIFAGIVSLGIMATGFLFNQLLTY